MTSSPRQSPANRWLRGAGPLSVAAHIGYATSLIVHIGLGTIALLIAVVTALNDNLAADERLDVNDTQLGLAILLWVIAFAAVGVLWARRFPWGWIAPFIWALIGLPLAVTHAQVETIPPPSACAIDGRIESGLTAAGRNALPPLSWCYEAGSTIHEIAALDETVYLASTSGKLTALNRASGAIDWESPVGAALGAIVARPGLVVGGSVANVTAWDSSGQSLWTVATPAPVGSLAVNGTNDVYVACADGTIMALDGATGEVRWTSLSPVLNAQLIVAGQEIYAFNATRAITIAVLDVASGEVRSAWIYDIGPLTYFTPPILVGTTLVAGYEVRSDGGSPLSGGVLGMDPATGAVRWDRSVEAPVQIAPVNVEGTVHVLALNGQLYRLETISGQDIRPREIIESRGIGEQDADRLLATDGDTIYISQRGGAASADSAYSGVVTATDTTGAALWRFRLSEQPSLPVTIAGDAVFVPDGRALFAIHVPAQATSEATPVQ